MWLAFFLIYAATTAWDVLPADSGEFQLIAARWGIAHPPGYPLYTVLGGLWVSLLPFGSVAFRLNLLSAFLAATTLLLLFDAVRVWATTWGQAPRAACLGGLGAVLALGAASTFWAQATIANIRMPTMLFTAWAFLALAKWDRKQEARSRKQGSVSERVSEKASGRVNPQHPQLTTHNPQPTTLFPISYFPLLELALALGLGVGHHASLIFFAAGWGVYVLLREPGLLLRPHRWWAAVPVAALAWGIPQLYLLLRGNVPGVVLSPGNLGTWDAFWNHVLARGFGGDMFAFATAADLAQRLPLLPTLFRLQFPFWMLGFIGLSWLWLLWRHPRLAVAFLVSWGIHTFVTITYRAPQTVEYLMPAYIPMALTLGLGMAALAQGITNYELRMTNDELRIANYELRIANRLASCILRLASFLFPISYFLLLARIPAGAGNFVLLVADPSIRARSLPLLTEAPQGALVLADWHWATPLWVLQQVEGVRPDVEVLYQHPKTADFSSEWQSIAEAAGDRAIFTTHSFDDWDGWTFAPVGGGFRAYRRPLTDLPADLGFTPLDADLGMLKLRGCRWLDLQTGSVLPAGWGGVLRPGQQVELQLAWQATGVQEPAPSFTARLWDADGGLLAASDRFLGSDTASGEVRFTRLTLQLPLDRCSNAVYPTVGAYTVQNGAFQDLGSTSLPAVTLSCDFPTLPAAHWTPGVVLGRGPFLRGVDYDVSGDRVTAYLHWCGPGAGLQVAAGESRAVVTPLGVGECQTICLEGFGGSLALTYGDAQPAHLLSWPLRRPQPGERYVPFGDEAVLTGSEITQRGGQVVVDLEWHVVRPIVNDYGVSVRLLDANRVLLVSPHDSQPGLGALPTLKWLTRGATLLDPHRFDEPSAPPNAIGIVVYERFRMTPLQSSQGEVFTYSSP